MLVHDPSSGSPKSMESVIAISKRRRAVLMVEFRRCVMLAGIRRGALPADCYRHALVACTTFAAPAVVRPIMLMSDTDAPRHACFVLEISGVRFRARHWRQRYRRRRRHHHTLRASSPRDAWQEYKACSQRCMHFERSWVGYIFEKPPRLYISNSAANRLGLVVPADSLEAVRTHPPAGLTESVWDARPGLASLPARFPAGDAALHGRRRSHIAGM